MACPPPLLRHKILPDGRENARADDAVRWSDPDMAARYQRSDEAYELEMIARMEAHAASVQ